MIFTPAKTNLPSMDGETGSISVPSPVVEFENVGFGWPGKKSFVIKVAAFSLFKGEKVLLLGPSGSGKSTLLSLLCAIVLPDRGRITVLETSLTTLSSSARDRFRAEHFGIIFQMFNLLPYGSVMDNVLLPLSFAHQRRMRSSQNAGMENDARTILDRLGLEPEEIGASRANQLSVGQQQRVAVARALIGSPEIIVADEPTSALDRDHQRLFLGFLFEQISTSNATLIMVSHDDTLSSEFDRVIRIDEVLCPDNEEMRMEKMG
jgi:putative ABC transport system ATP-binding protein